MTSGIITLHYETDIISIKKYKDKKEREAIVKSWEKIYALKNRIAEITILPNESKKEVAGVIELYQDEFLLDRRKYHSIDDRDEMINEARKYYEYFTINIKPIL
jgi:hypothetical protein